MNHFISVIIPVYNGSKTLGVCLESIFSSPYPHFECIVVDDHSSDNTVRIAKSSHAKIIPLDRQQGASHARNAGAEAARGDILLFVDADVKIYEDCLHKIARTFEGNPEISALFGSYDDQPGCPNFLSQYRNLLHHYIHQTSREDASTFWTGLGAIRRQVFFNVGKFNENTRMMEDIELGYKMKIKKHKILLVKDLFVKHLKHYSFPNLLKSDLFDRAIPWTILMLRNRQFTSDLNLKPQHKLSAIILILLIASILMTPISIWFILAFPLLLAVFFLLNFHFYKYFLSKRGLMFTLKVIPFHFLYYLYSTLGFVMGYFEYLREKYMDKCSFRFLGEKIRLFLLKTR